MKPASVILASAMLALWQTAAFGGEWYVHRESRQTKEPPLLLLLLQPVESQRAGGQGDLSHGHAGQRGAGDRQAEGLCGPARHMPQQLRRRTARPGWQHRPRARASEARPCTCTRMPEVRAGRRLLRLCNGMAAGYESTPGAEIKKCISDCLDKFHCKQ